MVQTIGKITKDIKNHISFLRPISTQHTCVRMIWKTISSLLGHQLFSMGDNGERIIKYFCILIIFWSNWFVVMAGCWKSPSTAGRFGTRFFSRISQLGVRRGGGFARSRLELGTDNFKTYIKSISVNFASQLSSRQKSRDVLILTNYRWNMFPLFIS